MTKQSARFCESIKHRITSNSVKKLTCLLHILFLLGAAHDLSATQYSETLFFTAGDVFVEKELFQQSTTFDCVGDIHLVQSLKANNYELRNRRLLVEWINPRDQTEITTDRPSYLEQGENAYRWTSITLKRPKGGGLFSLLDPAAGMERFIGTWRAKVFLDDEHVETLEFVVEC